MIEIDIKKVYTLKEISDIADVLFPEPKECYIDGVEDKLFPQNIELNNIDEQTIKSTNEKLTLQGKFRFLLLQIRGINQSLCINYTDTGLLYDNNAYELEKQREEYEKFLYNFLHSQNKTDSVVFYNSHIQPQQESKPVEEGANVPTLWKSKKYFMEMLTEAVAMGLLEHDGKGGYVWQMSNSLYGVFVYRISKEFGIMSVCKKRDKTSTQSTQRIQWTKFGKFIHAANAEDKAMMATAMTVVAEHRDKTKWACDDFSIIVGNEYINKLIAYIKILKQRS